MLFNSWAFILAFAPVVIGGAWALKRALGNAAVVRWLALASLVFYGISSPHDLPILVVSIGINHWIAHRLHASGRSGRRWLWLGVGGNLLALFAYKYAGFAAIVLNAGLGTAVPVPSIVLPIGISFFTFTQIAYLVDAHRDHSGPYRLVPYALFVSYFPHLVAGPILRHDSTIPQFATQRFAGMRQEDIERGLVLFALGLAKKILVADSLAPFADAGFKAADDGTMLTLWESWLSLLTYSFQIYFDFSGYSDMALGLSLMLGVDIPINFLSPYRARSIIEFWRRWHISLSSFLRDYLYVPLGGNRLGPARRYLNLMLTMLIGGLWHGAAWGFLVWGGLHGFYLLVNHAWRKTRGADKPGASLSAGVLTFLAVILAWSFFRARTLSGGLNLVAGALGLHGVALPQSLPGLAAQLNAWIPGIPWFAAGMFQNDLTEHKLAWMSWTALAAVLAWGAPRSTQLAQVEAQDQTATRARPSRLTCLLAGLLLALCLISLQQESPFLYFQF